MEAASKLVSVVDDVVNHLVVHYFQMYDGCTGGSFLCAAHVGSSWLIVEGLIVVAVLA